MEAVSFRYPLWIRYFRIFNKVLLIFLGENNNEGEDKKASSNSSNFTYSLEKFMDPNRPFKCDVCKESFTQKNILLVHYNSVSHLHRLKKTMQESQNSQVGGSAPANPASSTPEKSSKGSALEALLGKFPLCLVLLPSIAQCSYRKGHAYLVKNPMVFLLGSTTKFV